jgi:hypothetical protein
MAPRLLVRLIDPGSADPVGYSVLMPAVAEDQAAGRPFFEGVVPLRGASPGGLRADVYDDVSTVPPAPSDRDESLSQARRAAIFLGEWRSLRAAAQVRAGRFDLAGSIHLLTTHVSSDDESVSAQPLFAGGPSPSDIRRLAELDPEAFGATGDGRLLMMTQGPGALLVAELAAANAEGVAS